jgi:hypothetical protein
MAFIESDDVVEQIAAAVSHPALGNPVLPGTLDRGLRASNLQSAKGSGKQIESSRNLSRTFFSLRRRREFSSRLPAPLTREDARLVSCPGL